MQERRNLLQYTKRWLFTCKTKRNKALFISHAGSYGLHWALKKSVHAKQYLKENMTVFYRRPWFCDVHETHYDNQWGQTLAELPYYIRDIFLNHISLQHPIDVPLTFKHMKDLHEYIAHEISKDFSGSFIDLDDAWVPVLEKKNDGLYVTVDNQSYLLPPDTFFYNWLRKPREHGWPHLEQRYISDIYFLPKDYFLPNTYPGENAYKSVLIQGASLTIPWLIRDFPGITIGMLRRKEDEIRKVPRNAKIDLSQVREFIIGENHKIYRLDGQLCGFTNADIKSSGKGTIGMLSYKNKETGKPDTFSGHFYAGMGSEPDSAITYILSGDQKIEIEKIDKNTPPLKKWIAPQNVPTDSLTHSFFQFMSKTRNADQCFDPQHYHENDFREIFSSQFPLGEMGKKVFHDGFFKKIEKEIESYPSPKQMVDFHKFFEETVHEELKKGLTEPISNHVNYAYKMKV